jgi:hypothetical protein
VATSTISLHLDKELILRGSLSALSKFASRLTRPHETLKRPRVDHLQSTTALAEPQVAKAASQQLCAIFCACGGSWRLLDETAAALSVALSRHPHVAPFLVDMCADCADKQGPRSALLTSLLFEILREVDLHDKASGGRNVATFLELLAQKDKSVPALAL